LGRMTRTVWNMYQTAKREEADIYHFHDPELIPIGLLLRASGKGVIYDIHEDMPKEILSKHYLPEWGREFLSWIVGRIEDFASGRFSALVTVTPSIASRFRAFNPRTVIVHNYPYADELVRSNCATPWSDRRQAVAYLGGLTRHRAVQEMVYAMGLLPHSLSA